MYEGPIVKKSTANQPYSLFWHPC